MDSARRQAYLDAMGIQTWVSRDRLSEGQAVAGAPVVVDAGSVTPEPVVATPEPPPAPARAGGFPSEMLRAALRGEADVAPLPESPKRPPPPVESRQAVDVRPALDLDGLDWPQLAEVVAGCRNCELHSTRTQAVFGVGDQRARLMIVGEAPGADEDRQGEPFVGPAGQLLNAMLVAIGLQREQVYITNIIKCRPPSNRDPHVEEAAACRGFLDRQIALLQPELILCLGAVSAHHLLATDLPVGKLRGRPHQLPMGANVAVTYHPAYLLRKPEEKVKVWHDLQRVARLLQGERG